MTLTLELDLDVFMLDLRAKIQVSMYVCLARKVRRTDTQTDRQTDRHRNDVKTITPAADAGCNYYTRHITDVGCNN